MDLIMLIVYLGIIVAWVAAVRDLLEAIKEKGHGFKFTYAIIGIFLTPVTLGLIAAALPDRGGFRQSLAQHPDQNSNQHLSS